MLFVRHIVQEQVVSWVHSAVLGVRTSEKIMFCVGLFACADGMSVGLLLGLSGSAD